MQGVLITLIFVAAMISKPVAARAWRAGRLSDSTTAILLLGRFPVLVFLFGVLLGGEPLFVLTVTALATLSTLAFYRFIRGLRREQRAT